MYTTVFLCIVFIYSFNLISTGSASGEPLSYCLYGSKYQIECWRRNQIYSTDGSLCVNQGERGLCHVTQTLIAINFGASEAVSVPPGIQYIPEVNVSKEDKARIHHPIMFPPGPILADPPYKRLLTTGFVADPSNCAQWTDPSITYQIPSKILTPGLYEIGLIFIQAPPTQIGYRRFNTYLSGKPIVQDSDLMRASEQQYTPVTVYIHMEISVNNNIVLGSSMRPLENTVSLEFRFGRCGESKGYVVNGFHIVKTGSKPPCNGTQPDPCCG